ncbi:hypothetical protein SAMD00019534_012370, partial [Acytostelium subglobosum LB1]|uniref:hypothetical protein n=1 Tax=Acytostelium subglobosum LB1 TaxID=1410327 RepID=UPI0006447CD1
RNKRHSLIEIGYRNRKMAVALTKTVISMNSFIESLVKLFAQTAGKDKLAKILQYGAKLFGHMCQQRKKAEWTGIWKKIETSAGGARKVWRLGNTFSEQQKILQIIKAGNVFQILNLLALCRQTGMYFYWVFDHLVWTTSVGVTKLDTAKLSWYSSVSWFIGLLCSIIIDIQTLNLTIKKERQLIVALTSAPTPQQEGDSAIVPVDNTKLKAELTTVQKKKNELYLNCIKNGADSIVAANLLKFYQTSQGTVGMAGLVSAIIGGYQMWPAAPAPAS